jgi:hypothetical protein
VDESTPFGREPTWVTFVDSLKEEFYHVENYDEQYMRWMTLHQKRDRRCQSTLKYSIPCDQRWLSKTLSDTLF